MAIDKISPSVQYLAATVCMRTAKACFAATSDGPIDFALQSPQVLQVTATSQSPPSILVALDFILDQQQLGIVGMNGQSLCNPSQGCKWIAGSLQLSSSRNPVLHRACFFSGDDQAKDAFGRRMRRVQGQRLIGQRLGFQPIGFYNRMRLLNEGIGQNGAGERITFIQFVGFAQQLNGFRGLPLGEQFLAFGDKAVGFGVALDTIMGKLFQFGQLRIVGEFGRSCLATNPGRESSRTTADRC